MRFDGIPPPMRLPLCSKNHPLISSPLSTRRPYPCLPGSRSILSVSPPLSSRPLSSSPGSITVAMFSFRSPAPVFTIDHRHNYDRAAIRRDREDRRIRFARDELPQARCPH